MGNYLFVTRPPETSIMSTPVCTSIFTDVTAPIGHHDGDDCFPFQLRWIDCCEAYGRDMGRVKCKYLYQDMIECSRKWKQKARCSDMMERHYQLWFQGVMGKGPKRDLYFETPRYDGYVPHFPYDDTHYKIK